jgi:transcriptional regulator with XRE-family HTH domain
MHSQALAINEDSTPSKDYEGVLHRLLGEIETVRLKRQEEYRDQGHPQSKRFTQQELNDEVCPTYKNLLIGRSNRLPSRSMLMTIADYLECPLSERNDLLLAAQYLPEQSMWEGDVLRQALDHAQQIMETLPYPAIMVTHLYQVQAANKFFLHLLDSPSLETLPLHQRSMMHLIFDTGIRRRTMINAEEHATWEKHVLYAIQHFKQQNLLYQYDAWYRQSVQQWCDDIPCFREYWEQSEEIAKQDLAPSKLIFARVTTTGEMLPIHVRNMLISVSNKTYPAVAALLPVDDAARAVYASYDSADSSAH